MHIQGYSPRLDGRQIHRCWLLSDSRATKGTSTYPREDEGRSRPGERASLANRQEQARASAATTRSLRTNSERLLGRAVDARFASRTQQRAVTAPVEVRFRAPLPARTRLRAGDQTGSRTRGWNGWGDAGAPEGRDTGVEIVRSANHHARPWTVRRGLGSLEHLRAFRRCPGLRLRSSGSRDG